MTEPTDSEIIALADATRTGEPGRDGYVLPISFARAVLAKWGTPPEVARTETIELRRMLCAAHAGHLAYMDDGEAQDNREFPLIDFLRDSPPEIQDKLHRRALKKFSTPQPTQAQAVQEWDPVPAKACIKPTHEAADAFWEYWKAKGETHKHGYYESTWGAINKALACGWTQPTQAQAGAVPLTAYQIHEAIKAFKDSENLMGVNHIHVARAIERAHGIGIKGGQHDI